MPTRVTISSSKVFQSELDDAQAATVEAQSGSLKPIGYNQQITTAQVAVTKPTPAVVGPVTPAPATPT